VERRKNEAYVLMIWDVKIHECTIIVGMSLIFQVSLRCTRLDLYVFGC
jgi:hypothetical protein